MENRECLGVIVKDMSKSKDKGFTFKVISSIKKVKRIFKIDMGDRIFHLNASSVADVEQ